MVFCMKIFYFFICLAILSGCGKSVTYGGGNQTQQKNNAMQQQKDVFLLNNAINQNSKQSALSKSEGQTFKMGMTDTMPNADKKTTNEQKTTSNIYKQPAKKSYKIQCGFFKNESLAVQVVDDVIESGIYDVKIANDSDGYRVLVGDFASKADGKKTWDKLTQNGFDLKFWTFR